MGYDRLFTVTRSFLFFLLLMFTSVEWMARLHFLLWMLQWPQIRDKLLSIMYKYKIYTKMAHEVLIAAAEHYKTPVEE